MVDLWSCHASKYSNLIALKFTKELLFVLLFTTTAVSLKANTPATTGEKSYYTDPGIHTVLFYREGWEFSLPVLELGSLQTLVCKFDHLSQVATNYRYTLIHCDADWNTSRLVSAEYLDGFAENGINDYAFSINTTIPFVNYRIVLPNDQVRILHSGNYLLKIWEEGKKEKPVVVRPFYVTEKLADLSGEVQKATYEGYRGESQQISFVVNYNKLTIADPLNEIKAVVMQNGRADNRLIHLKPTFIRQNQLVYEEKNNLFAGGNEFRNFDAKNLQTNGMGVSSISYLDPYFHLFLVKDQSQGKEIYRRKDDLNGNFLVKNDRARDSDLESDYLLAHFFFTPPDLVTNDQIYVFGGLSDWQCQASNLMNYNPETKMYEATILLKQGFYDYQYVMFNRDRQSIDASFLEGSHVETENSYHLFVYYRGFSSRYDRLIGYRTINSVIR
ncbi:DUF5103 domain-containing protein [bacterium]|nr:DUF5103 domain-containing protein [bacterium]